MALHCRTNLVAGAWLNVPGWTNVVGSNCTDTLSDTNAAGFKFYRVKVRLQ